MADRGILFSAPMVRALLDGRKTQTRRLCAWANNPNSPALTPIVACDEPGWFGDEEGEVQFKAAHVPGDRLYVREAWSTHPAFDGIKPCELKRGCMIYTRADDAWHNNSDWIGAPYGRRRAGMHMPRWASRLTNIVADVRVERLQDISEADAIAEGLIPGVFPGFWRSPADLSRDYPSAKAAYAALWTAINGPGSWEANPWVVATTFTVERRNIDQEAA